MITWIMLFSAFKLWMISIKDQKQEYHLNAFQTSDNFFCHHSLFIINSLSRKYFSSASIACTLYNFETQCIESNCI